MNALELNAEIYRNLGVIAEDESLLKKAAKYLRKLAKQAEEDETQMTKEDFFARVDKAKKEPSCRMLPNEDLTAFLKRQGYDI